METKKHGVIVGQDNNVIAFKFLSVPYQGAYPAADYAEKQLGAFLVVLVWMICVPEQWHALVELRIDAYVHIIAWIAFLQPVTGVKINQGHAAVRQTIPDYK